MRVVVVACRDNGDVDLDDLRAKVAEHAERLSALMITYPSTHGVYEHDIAEICAAVHDAGGQVYVDGANLNALVGLARPGQVRRRRQPPEPAQDVLHPARRRRPRRRAGRGALAPGAVSCPGTRWPTSSPTSYTVSAAPYGSASILPITWAYIRMMGAHGPARGDR